MLQANPQDQVTHNATKDPNISIPPPVSYSPGIIAVAINALLFSSLILSLGAALGAMLVKQWPQRYQRQGYTSIARQAARNRFIHHRGLLDWHLPDLVAWIPMTLHVASVTFLIAVILWLHVLNEALFIATLSLVTIGATIHPVFAAIPLFASNAPFYWPLSSFLRSLAGPDLDPRRTVTPYLLTPSLKADSPQTKAVDEFDLVDALVIIDLLRETEVKEEIESALEQLRTAKWNENEISHALFKNGEIILQRCTEVAGTVYYTSESNHYLRDAMQERARRLCRFIEWFYYHISPHDRTSLKIVAGHKCPGPRPKADS
jgi:hypothetical protein